ncbi:hypothetical protein LCGC14_1908130 [marine sediment metagenome]|uniref:Uncharacterized protein n=1 Tax=marine sediment metagenome TaxID=412755 RepID=A0A0F9GHQ2_9ZZZZ|nr:hypothetical protein [archaeon]
MPRKFSWFIFFIIVSSTASAGLLFIPYSVTKVIDWGYPTGSGHGLSQFNSYYTQPVEFPWRSHTQEIFLNISVERGTISIQMLGVKEFKFYLNGDPYAYYWEVENITTFTTSIQITPPFQSNIVLLFYAEEYPLVEEDGILYWSELKVSYIRYASSYGLFFFGVAVILISSYGYRRYKWR